MLQQVFQFSCIFYETDYSLLFINLWRSCVVDLFASKDVKIIDEILEIMFEMHHTPIPETNLPRLILFAIVLSLFFANLLLVLFSMLRCQLTNMNAYINN